MGIPLLLVCLATIGKYLSGIWDTLISRLSCKRTLASKHRDIYSFGILIVLGLIVVVFIPAIIFTKIEAQWSYVDAVYFAIISLTTVGFGDFTPARDHLRDLKYIVLYLIWLFIGFAIVSVLVTKMSEIYTRVNKSTITLSKRCLEKCLLRVKKNDHPLLSDDSIELNSLTY